MNTAHGAFKMAGGALNGPFHRFNLGMMTL
jgi:hypothetical protein